MRRVKTSPLRLLGGVTPALTVVVCCLVVLLRCMPHAHATEHGDGHGSPERESCAVCLALGAVSTGVVGEAILPPAPLGTGWTFTHREPPLQRAPAVRGHSARAPPPLA